MNFDNVEREGSPWILDKAYAIMKKSDIPIEAESDNTIRIDSL